MRTSNRECVESHRLMGSGHGAPEVRLELWEHERDLRDDSQWAVAFDTDSSPHGGETLRMRVDDEEAGWLRRNLRGDSGDG